MSGYDERQQAMETKLAHDSELRFKVTNRRNRLLGQWAAEQLGLIGEPGDEYARSVVLSDFEQPGDDDVVRKVLGDLADGGVDATEAQIRAKMAELQPLAQQQVHDEA